MYLETSSAAPDMHSAARFMRFAAEKRALRQTLKGLKIKFFRTLYLDYERAYIIYFVLGQKYYVNFFKQLYFWKIMEGSHINNSTARGSGNVLSLRLHPICQEFLMMHDFFIILTVHFRQFPISIADFT